MNLSDDTIQFLGDFVSRLKRYSWSFYNLIGQDKEWTPRVLPRTVSASANVNPLDDLILVSGNTTMTLETAVACDGRVHTFKKTDSSATTMTIACTGSETLDGAATQGIGTQYESITVKSNGTNWGVVGRSFVISGFAVTWLGNTTSANLAAAVTDETGSGALVFGTSPTLTTPKATTTIGVGNATAAASGAGISFPATASASTDANTLDDYEEGTWTPTDVSGASLTLTTPSGEYTITGREVFIRGFVVYPVTANGSSAAIGSLPVAVPNRNSAYSGCLVYANTTNANFYAVSIGSSAGNFYTTAGVACTNVQLSTASLIFSANYPAA